MRRYFRILWIALCGGYKTSVVVKEEYLEALQARIAKYERRANAQRIARANRAIDKSSGFQIANTGSGDF